jgi:hypothetical protein
MNSSIDLNLLLLARQAGNLVSDLPDLYAVTPPRRTARGRESDSLIMYLSMTGNSPLAPESQTQLLEQLAHKFYKTTGSLTAAMRSIVEALNLFLLDRNLRSTSQGRQGIGQLLLVALRADTLYLAQCGLVHAFVVTPKDTLHLYDPQSSGRGLGFSRTAPIRFLQTRLVAGEYLVLSTSASPGWTEATLKDPQGVEMLRTQLLQAAGPDFNAVIVQAQAGTGKFRLLRRKLEAPEAAGPLPADQPTGIPTTETPTTPIKAEESPEEDHGLGMTASETLSTELPSPTQAGVQPESAAAVIPGEALDHEISGEQAPEEPASVSPPVPQEISSPAPAIETPAPTPTVTWETEPEPSSASVPSEALSPTQPPTTAAEPLYRRQRERPALKPVPWAKYTASIRSRLAPVGSGAVRALSNALATIGAALLRLLKNLLPDEEILRVPPSAMIFIAVAIPLILAVVGGMIFLQRGRAQQYQTYYQQAAEQASQLASLTNPMEERQALKAALSDLDKAEYYTVTTESQSLRTQLTTQLDTLDAVKRLDYKQAIYGGLDSTVSITHIVAPGTTSKDLYLLNGKQGIVLRAIMTARGYEVDPNFQCGPTYGPISVGPLVDIAELPLGSFENASILGMDANGNLLYCVVGSQPYSAATAPPNTGFGEPIAMTLDRGDLYVLDPKVNAVWIYRNMEVSQQPRLFFGETVPPMQDVIDLAVYNDDLFLLHADGHMTKCTYSGMPQSPTRCDDPYPYSDNRPGRVHGPVIAESVFNQMFFSSFPERSIYMLDPQNRSIFYFSVLLTLQWQYQSQNTLAQGKATAFAISPNRMAFLAVGSNVYYAAIP